MRSEVRHHEAEGRRDVVGASLSFAASFALLAPSRANAAAAVQDSIDLENFLRTGVDAGKSGDVSAEILVGTKAQPSSVLVSFTAPYKLETGSVFDVECRDGKTGDGAFLAVTTPANGKALGELPSSFFLERLFDPTGRFSFYGPPTDVKVKKSTMIDDATRVLDVSFSNLSQSTNAEIPRKAVLVATIPKGTDNAVMLVASANEGRWKKGGEDRARGIVESFRAIPAPKTNMKLRAKDRSGGSSLDF
ncbi:hypothetical protein ACHAXT_009710 [Thalassiosira profunda]